MEWLSSQDGVYWISGKPGSGKSILVEHLVRHDRTKLELQKNDHISWITLPFFFDFRGGKNINNSFEGLLRSLLRQVIDAIPQLDVPELDAGEHETISDWPEFRLCDALRRSLKNVNKGVCIFVDGLDEYEGSVLLLIQFLKSLVSSKNPLTKLCVSSRPEPIPSQLLQDLPTLSMSEHNASGIRSYCLRTLRDLDPAVCDDFDISQLSCSIAERAEGMFLWARFALDELIRGYCESEEMDELMERLERIPRNIEEVYDRMLARLESPAKEECMIMLQLVSFAKRPLSWQELCVAIKFAMNTDRTIVEHIGDDTDSAEASKQYKTFAKRIRAKAVGLLELVNFPDARPGQSVIGPKLIHRSVQTYLNQKGWQTLKGLEGNNLLRHEYLYVETCTRYLRSLLSHCEFKNGTSQSVLKTWLRKEGLFGQLPNSNFPFFTYAVSYIFGHASSLEQDGHSSHPQLQEALTEQVYYLHCVARKSTSIPCVSCVDMFEEFDSIHVAILYGLILYCKDDLRVRSPPPTQSLWQRALIFILFSDGSQKEYEMMSLVLHNLITITTPHLVIASLRAFANTVYIWRLKLVLEHPSVQNFQLVDAKGRNATFLWLFALHECGSCETAFNLLISRAKRRGESVRERCGSEGNLVEMLLKQRPSQRRRSKLSLIHKHYQSMSWPFEYDLREVEDDGIEFLSNGTIRRRELKTVFG